MFKRKQTSIGTPHSPIESLYSLQITIVQAKGLVAADVNGLSDPFCKIGVREQGSKSGPSSFTKKTSVVKKTVSPMWNETFTLG
jgi:Ca2+-dependent lipid-binding protein